MTKNFFSEVTENESLMMGGGYKTPAVKVLTFQPEGVLCASGLTEKFNEQDFSNGGFWD